MKKIQLFSMILLAVFALSSCKKVAPEVSTAAQSYTEATTFVGTGVGAYVEGVGQNAALYAPYGMVTDAAGNLYVADQSNHRIRKITPEGQTSTFAGTGEVGYVDGPGTSAQFFYPAGIAMDAFGNLYVSDSGNDVIRKITPSGVVSTYAGSGQRGFADGAAANAKFKGLSGLAIDKAGNLYVVDSYNYVIRKITSSGIVSTVAGTPTISSDYARLYSGPASGVEFGFVIQGIAVDPLGNVYVADGSKNFIWKITPDGMASTWAGNGQKLGGDVIRVYKDGPKGSAMFSTPFGMAFDEDGNLYIADTGNNRIRKISVEGIVSTVAGNGKSEDIDGRVPDASIYAPLTVAFDGNGIIYVATTGNNISKIEIKGNTDTPKNIWNNPQTWGNPK